MLKVKYFKEFKNHEPFIVVDGTSEDYLRAAQFLENKRSAYLNDSEISTYYESSSISSKELYLTRQECLDLAEIFYDLSTRNKSGCHDYYQTQALGEDIELLITYYEYPQTIFEEED